MSNFESYNTLFFVSLVNNMFSYSVKDDMSSQKMIDFLKGKPIQKIQPKQILLEEGTVARKAYFIVKGLLRMYFYDKGRDISFQFFLDKSIVCSFDSFYGNTPSMFYIESIEEAELIVIDKEELIRFIDSDITIRKSFEKFLASRFHVYQQLFLSRIRNTPAERYEELVKTNPELLRRIPQHYIASYLGITPVSLSRIRNKR